MQSQVQITMPDNLPLNKEEKDNQKLAMYYFEQKEYDKANSLLNSLHDKNPDAWYDIYFKSLLGVSDFSRAEKITKQKIKRTKNEVHFYVNLAKVYGLQKEEKKQKDCYEKALKELPLSSPYIENLAQAFIDEKLYDYALTVYDRVKKANDNYPYYYNKAEIYKLKNDLPGMINEYLDALEFRDTELQTVQINLQNSLGYDDESGGIKNPLLKQELQKRILKNPEKPILIEFLIFIQKQQKDFNGAFIQSKALDKRLKETGQRVYELGHTCYENKDYATAQKCFDYLLEKGQDSFFYELAKIDGLHVNFLALTETPQTNATLLLELEQKLLAAYKKYQESSYQSQILKDLIQLQAYYLNKTQEATQLLENFINLAGTEAIIKAEYKIMLADIYLIKGEIWDASLLYSQVEKDFKYEPIGQDAKFRNAKLSFYAGDFAWAKVQADVLKGATSKLISNDAIDLSLVISDAIGIDTNEAPLKLYAHANLLILQHRFQEAIVKMDSINLLFSNNTLVDDIYFKKADIFMKLLQYKDAETMYKNILDYFPTELYGDDAQFKLAELYDLILNNKEKAKQAYEQVMLNYPGSTYAVEARKRFRELRGDVISN
ncbi:MAG: tetratricopeptide repeat protein [Bacteroidota bacterium]